VLISSQFIIHWFLAPKPWVLGWQPKELFPFLLTNFELDCLMLNPSYPWMSTSKFDMVHFSGSEIGWVDIDLEVFWKVFG
jgi:hypothetical protein